MHRGRKKCVVKEGQYGRINQYFLRSQSRKSDEVQWRVENHSPKGIDNTATEVEEEVLRRDAADTEVNRPVRERNMEQKARVKWPRANSNKEWEAVNRDLSIILGRLGGNGSNRLEKMGDKIYSYGAERFGLQDRKRVERKNLVKSRWQRGKVN